jgi:hypothetical protein
MLLHLYCIVPVAHPVPEDCIGLQSRRPFAVPAGRLAIWATEHDEPVAPDIEVVRSHNAVVTAAMDRNVTPVPLRFGQSAGSRDAAAERIAEEAAKWSSLLERFAGRAEYGVRVVRDLSDAEQDVRAAPVASGTEYMAALARRQARAAERRGAGERLADRIASRVGDLVDDARVEYASAGELLVTIAHLVAWQAAEAYHGAMSEVRETSQHTRFVLTGPWPPYSFVQ